jgi:hypothetical protein
VIEGEVSATSTNSGKPERRQVSPYDDGAALEIAAASYHSVVCSIGDPMKQRDPPLSKAELRAAGQHAVAESRKPIVQLPTKLIRRCGHCGEFGSMMVERGRSAPDFNCKKCGYLMK